MVRIIQIATLVTPDGAYGGPIRVATNQTRALRQAGHQVDLVAGAAGFEGSLPATFDGVDLKLFRARKIPGLGFSGTFSLGLHRWLRQNIGNADAVHIHMGRDLVTLPAALLAKKFGVPYVLQTHGMVIPTSHPLGGVIDRMWTLPALQSSSQTLYLTPAEREGVTAICPRIPAMSYLPNGVPPSDPSDEPDAQDKFEVLFLARLHERKRPLVFIEMAKLLHQEFPDVRFTLVGPDGGEGNAVDRAIQAATASDFVRWEGPIAPELTASRIGRCDLYVLPSVDEPFPMSVLEALAEGKPVVVTNSCGLAPAVSDAVAGAVVDDTVVALTTAVRRFLKNEGYRRRAGANARTLAATQFSMSHVVRQLENVYEEVSTLG